MCVRSLLCWISFCDHVSIFLPKSVQTPVRSRPCKRGDFGIIGTNKRKKRQNRNISYIIPNLWTSNNTDVSLLKTWKIIQTKNEFTFFFNTYFFKQRGDFGQLISARCHSQMSKKPWEKKVQCTYNYISVISFQMIIRFKRYLQIPKSPLWNPKLPRVLKSPCLTVALKSNVIIKITDLLQIASKWIWMWLAVAVAM